MYITLLVLTDYKCVIFCINVRLTTAVTSRPLLTTLAVPPLLHNAHLSFYPESQEWAAEHSSEDDGLFSEFPLWQHASLRKRRLYQGSVAHSESLAAARHQRAITIGPAPKGDYHNTPGFDHQEPREFNGPKKP